jgi:hypothetical protein
MLFKEHQVYFHLEEYNTIKHVQTALLSSVAKVTQCPLPPRYRYIARVLRLVSAVTPNTRGWLQHVITDCNVVSNP